MVYQKSEMLARPKFRIVGTKEGFARSSLKLEKRRNAMEIATAIILLYLLARIAVSRRIDNAVARWIRSSGPEAEK